MLVVARPRVAWYAVDGCRRSEESNGVQGRDLQCRWTWLIKRGCVQVNDNPGEPCDAEGTEISYLRQDGMV